jgi:chromosome segregation ATPase
LALERQVVGDELDSTRAAALKEVLQERARLEPAYRKLPKKKEEYEGRMETMRGRMQDLQKRAFRLKWEVEEMRRGIDGLGQWIVDNPGAMTPADEKELRERLGQADAEVKQLEGLQNELELAISKERGMITLTTEEQYAEEELRARYAATLEKEQDILSVGRVAVVGKNKQVLDGVEGQREMLSRYHIDLDKFKEHLSKLVGDKAYTIKAELLKEQSQLEAHATAIGSARSDAKRVVGEIAIASLHGVESTFRRIVLRGDVGIIDVAWTLKEGKTHEISRHVNQQRKELAVLDGEFEGIGDE